ncbi:T9SS type A sorting domain-containing protein [Mangrovibacterium marinum]|uniref:T9SS type A sorting domain-containing protein n=1 Tax=Mangrovibacterium marinum TaxID=1639118 RepID=UPI002A18E6F2|nr:T9SS type A sorting domain-containing protein [Mangrovibacterium marinum]
MENFYSNSTLTGYHRCWRYTMLLAVAMLTAMILPNTAMAQKDKETITGNILGPVPVQSPHNGTSIDGDAYAYHKDLIYKVPNLATPAEDDSLEFNFNNLGDIFYWGEVYPPDGNEVYPNDPEAGVLDVIWDGMGNGPENFDAVIHNFPDVVDDTTIVYADGIGNDDLTGFSSSTKMNDDPELEWTWGPVSSPQKDDMQNCGAIFTWGDPKIMGIDGEYGDPTELWCAFAADRKSVHGVSWISFEFLQASMEMTVTGTNSKGEEEGGFITDGPDGGRTVGDIIVFVGLFNGGDQADVKVNRWEWVESEGKFQYVEILSSLNDPVHGYPYGSILATVNTEVTPVHFPAFGQYDDFEINGEWYTLPYYEVNQWCEGAINVSALFDLDEDPCLTVSTCFISTRTSSQSTSSELKDFVAPIQLNIVADPPVAHCPDDPDLPACDLEEIETAYQAWVDGFGFEGGIEPFDESTDPESDNYDPIPELPTNLCDGVYLEYTYVVTDYCDHTDECTATFTVAAPEPLAFTCPTAPVIAECTPSSVIASTYNDWVQGIITGSATGECEVVVTVSPETYPGANLCDGETIPVTIHATSYDADGMVCDEDGCIVDFVVPATEDLAFTCPTAPVIAECTPSSVIASTYNDWVQGIITGSATGECEVVVTVSPETYPGANLCDGETIPVTIHATSYDADGMVCDEDGCTVDFVVPATEDLAFTCPTAPVIAECTPSSVIASTYNDWVQGIITGSATGECEVVVTVSPEIYPGANLCDGETIPVTIHATSYDADGMVCDEDGCTVDFVVPATEDLAFTCPTAPVIAECTPSSVIASTYNDWVQGIITGSATGECEVVVTVSPETYPGANLCDGETIPVTIHATSYDADGMVCDEDGCTVDFVVPATEDLAFTCPTAPVIAECTPSSVIASTYNDWVQGIITGSATGECEVVVTVSPETYPGANLCDGETIPVTIHATSYDADGMVCDEDGCTVDFVVPATEDLAFTCPTAPVIAECTPSSVIASTYNDWVQGIITGSATGECDVVVTVSPETYPGANLCDGETIPVTIHATSYDADGMVCDEDGCTVDFIVPATEDLAFTCPTAPVIAECTPSSVIASTYNDWVQGIITGSATGECEVVVTVSPETYPGANLCDGETIPVTIHATSYDADGMVCDEDGCTVDFVVPATEDLAFTCPTAPVIAECTPSSVIASTYNDWVQGIITGSATGECEVVVTVSPETYPGANLCDGETIPVTIHATSYDADGMVCDEDGCTVDFVVPATEDLAFTCPTAPVIAECTPSSVIASTYNDWVQGIITGSATGECEVVVTVSPETYPGANLCDGETIPVTIHATSYDADGMVCDEDGCTVDFIVPATEDLAFTCPTAPVIAECTPSSVIASTYNDWVQGIITGSATGECEVVVTVSPETYPGANLCDGETIPVTIHATSYDADGMVCDEDGCIVDFVVPATEDLAFTCPTAPVIAECTPSSVIASTYNDWVQGIITGSATGECEVVVTVSPETYPGANLCDGETIPVTIHATSYDADGMVCDEDGCTVDFVVPATPALVYTCPDDGGVAQCMSLEEVKADFAKWIADNSIASGGCKADVEVTPKELPEYNYCEGTEVSVLFIAKSYDAEGNVCETKECPATYKVAPCPCEHIFPTQTTCCHYLTGTAYELENVCFKAENGYVGVATPGVFFYYTDFEAPSANFTISVLQTNDGVIDRLFAVHGGKDIKLFDENCNSISIEVYADGDDGENAHAVVTGATPGATYVLGVKYNTKSIQGASRSGDVSTYDFVADFGSGPIAGSWGSIDAVAGCTDNTPLPGSCTLEPISPSIMTTESSLVTSMEMLAYPNPTTQEVNFEFTADRDGEAEIELYSMQGQKVATVLKQQVVKGQLVRATHRFSSDTHAAGQYIYRATLGGESLKGIVSYTKDRR